MKTHLAMQTTRAAYADRNATTPNGFTAEIANTNRYPLTPNGLLMAVFGCVNVTKTWIEASSLSIVVVTPEDMNSGRELINDALLFEMMTTAAAGDYDVLYQKCSNIMGGEFAYSDE